MQLNKTTTHAIRLLVACTRAESDMVKVADLARTLELTQQNTFKIVHLLSRAGFVSAMRGRNGGVSLARSADKIKVGDVVAAMEYSDLDSSKSSKQTSASAPNVPLIDEALSAFLEVLNQNSIADMAKAKPAGKTAGKRKASKSASSKPAAARKPVPRKPRNRAKPSARPNA